jgi:hypothetical protein
VVYVVERYLPGMVAADIVSALDQVERTAAKMRDEGTPIHYLGSTIVSQDEACLCQFDAPSEAVVVDLNQRAGLRVDRIVSGVAVSPQVETRRRQE